MPTPIKRPPNFKLFLDTIKEQQKSFRKAVTKAGAGAYFPLHETDKGRELDHHTLGFLEVFAWESLQNHLPNEFERIAFCPVCRYKNVDEVNYQVGLNNTDMKTLHDMFPMFTEQDLRVHAQVCLSRVQKAAMSVLPTPAEEKQVKTFKDRILSLDDKADALMDAAIAHGEFAAAAQTLKARHEILQTHGKATGEYQDAKVVATVTNNNLGIIKAIRMPTHKPENLLPPGEVLDVEYEDSSE